MRVILHGIGSRMVKAHKFASFGSFTWVGGSVRLMNELAAAQGLEVVSGGMPFRQAFNVAAPDVKSFVDQIIG